MPRHNGSQGIVHTIRQKGYARRGSGVETYSRRKKRLKADLYDRPYLNGSYRRDLLKDPEPQSTRRQKGHHHA